MMNERKTMVVKIGSSTLVEAGELRRDFIASSQRRLAICVMPAGTSWW